MSAGRPPPTRSATPPPTDVTDSLQRDETGITVRDERRWALGYAPRRITDGREAPLVLGRYRLHRRLGSGGFGSVWLAHDERLERDVAVKLLPRDRVIGGRFEREARAAARLSHPGIVTLYEAAVDDDGAYLVSELVRGGTLGQLLEAGRLSDRDVIEIGVALCGALMHAHANGVVHRDLKPSNVLIPEVASEPAEMAKLTDFGVARVIGGDTLTRTGDVIGTAAYMAPEQAEGLEAGALADLYSLALVIYEALSGVNPLAAGAPAQRARRLGAHLPPLRRQRRELPRELGRAVDLALRPRPRERGSIEELRGGLLASRDGVDDRPGIVEHPWHAGLLSARAGARASARPWASPDTGRLAAEPGAREVQEAAFVLDERSAQSVRGQAATARGEDEAAGRGTSVGWPARALAAGAGAGLAAWLSVHLFASSSLPPGAAAVIAGVAIAAAPRVAWLVLCAATTVVLVVQGRTGGALVVAPLALAPVVLLPRRGHRWPLAAAAPALGAIGLAGAWPAIAARAPSAWQRAALGITGWVWLLGAAALAHSSPYLAPLRGTPAPAVWIPSLYEATHHVLIPILTSGALAPAPLWGGAAAILPAVARVRPFALAVVMVTVWAAGLASATATVLGAAHAGLVVKSGTLALGAVLAAMIALVPAAVRERGVLLRARNPSGLA